MIELFQYDFMVRAMLAGFMIGIIAPVIGTFLVVRRFSLIADTIAHISFVGVALGLITHINPFLSSVFFTLFSSMGIEKLRESKKIYEESVLALYLSGSLALALIIISLVKGFNVNLLSFLFGNIMTVTINDLNIILSIGIVSMATVMLFYKEFFYITLDEELARAQGIPTKILNLVFMSVTALTISITLRIVGVLLTSALMIIPVITAQQWADSFKQTIFYSLFFSLASIFFGLFFSYYLDISSGGSIVGFAVLFFAASWIYKTSLN